MDIPSKIQAVITTPSKFFDSVKGEGFKPAFAYSVAITLINTIFATALVYVLVPAPITLGAIAAIAVGWASTFLLLLLGAGIMHLFVKLVGGKGNYTQTYKANIYASTPGMLLGWIPSVGIIFSLYGLYLNVKGLSKLHDISMKRAIAAVLIILAITVVILFATIYFAFSFFTRISDAATDQTQQQMEEQLNRLARTISIGSITESGILVKNTGSKTIPLSEIAIFTDGMPTECAWSAAVDLTPGSSAICAPSIACTPGVIVLVTAPGNTDRATC